MIWGKFPGFQRNYGFNILFSIKFLKFVYVSCPDQRSCLSAPFRFLFYLSDPPKNKLLEMNFNNQLKSSLPEKELKNIQDNLTRHVEVLSIKLAKEILAIIIH